MARPAKSSTKYDAKRQIIEAFLRFAGEIPIDKITVRMLTDAVGCNKTTFYYHFETIDDLHRQAFEHMDIDEASRFVVGKVLGGEWVDGAIDADERTVELFDKLCTLAFLNGAGHGRELVEDLVRERTAHALGVGPRESDVQAHTLFVFASGGIYEALRYRGSTGNAVPVAEFCSALYDTVVPALYAKLAARGIAR